MKIQTNPGKQLERKVKDKIYLRYPLKTHYIKTYEDYISLVKEYVTPVYEEGDILAISEKVISLCQGRVVYKQDIRLSFLAKVLSKFVKITPAGESVGNPYKMQVVMDIYGKGKVLLAAILAGIGKLFQKKGVFYEFLGQEASGLDGFCEDAFPEYLEMGIRIPEDANGVCNKIETITKIKCIIVDANDLGIVLLGKSDGILEKEATLLEILKDNPAGQKNQQTPFILIREEDVALAKAI